MAEKLRSDVAAVARITRPVCLQQAKDFSSQRWASANHSHDTRRWTEVHHCKTVKINNDKLVSHSGR